MSDAQLACFLLASPFLTLCVAWFVALAALSRMEGR